MNKKSKLFHEDIDKNGEICFLLDDLSHIIRLALSGKIEDIRLFLARLVRKYRKDHKELSERINQLLMDADNSPAEYLRLFHKDKNFEAEVPVDDDTKLPLLKFLTEKPESLRPIFSSAIENKIKQIILEWTHIEKLRENGLAPVRSVIFTGPPGVGKTLSARWIAANLNMPLFILNISAIMNSLFGKTGGNLSSVLNFARSHRCVIFLDEIDSIAKDRNDLADIGEVKRLVTVILQEIENWPSGSLLLAATNFPEIVDKAIWRRFDLNINFTLPSKKELNNIIDIFAKGDRFINGIKDILIPIFNKKSYSDIEKLIDRLRRINIIDKNLTLDIIIEEIISNLGNFDKKEKTDLCYSLYSKKLSKRSIANILNLHRDTVTKYIFDKESALQDKK